MEDRAKAKAHFNAPCNTSQLFSSGKLSKAIEKQRGLVLRYIRIRAVII